MTELLDLSKITEHDTVTLPGGISRELINRSELGIYEYQQVSSMQREAAMLAAAAEKGKLTAAKEKTLLRVLGALVKMLIPTVTPKELSKLGRAHREQIIMAWLAANFAPAELAAAVGGEQQVDPPRRPRTGGGSSRVSRRSTAATRKRGSTRRSG